MRAGRQRPVLSVDRGRRRPATIWMLDTRCWILGICVDLRNLRTLEAASAELQATSYKLQATSFKPSSASICGSLSSSPFARVRGPALFARRLGGSLALPAGASPSRRPAPDLRVSAESADAASCKLQAASCKPGEGRDRVVGRCSDTAKRESRRPGGASIRLRGRLRRTGPASTHPLIQPSARPPSARGSSHRTVGTGLGSADVARVRSGAPRESDSARTGGEANGQQKALRRGRQK